MYSQHDKDNYIKSRVNRVRVKRLKEEGFSIATIVKATGLSRPTVKKHYEYVYSNEPATESQYSYLSYLSHSHANGHAAYIVDLSVNNSKEHVSEAICMIQGGAVEDIELDEALGVFFHSKGRCRVTPDEIFEYARAKGITRAGILRRISEL